MKLTKDQILEYQKNRDPYLMIDYASDIEPGKYANGYKELKETIFVVSNEVQNNLIS